MESPLVIQIQNEIFMTSPFLERVWKMLSAKWGVQIAGMIFQTRSSVKINSVPTPSVLITLIF